MSAIPYVSLGEIRWHFIVESGWSVFPIAQGSAQTVDLASTQEWQFP